MFDLNPNPAKLVKYIRDGLVEQVHHGFVVLANKTKVIEEFGESKDYPFYLRSCAKPLQAALIIDYGMDIKYDMTMEEIAICCASHVGEKQHVGIAIDLMKKVGLTEGDLKCGLHAPLSKSERERMVLKNEKKNVYQNNCVGKHIMMLALCKMNNWNLESYYKSEHPVQVLIKDKINELCGVKNKYPETMDGCGVPILSMPLRKIVKGYLNLFLDERYEKIKMAFLDYGCIIGGEDRLDTIIMKSSSNLVAKVGACGLCVVINLEKEEGMIIKIADSDMKAREIAVLDFLKNLHWADIDTDHSIKTLHGDVVGEIVTLI